MALNQIKSSKDRVATLKTIRRQIDLCIKNCQLAQEFFISELDADNYEDHDIMWEGMQERMDAASAAATLAAADLTFMLGNDGFVFQYQWAIGQRGITAFTFNASADTCAITLTGGNSLDQGAGMVIENGDLIKIDGTVSNDGDFVVDSGSTGNTIEFSSGITDETCTTRGAKMTLVARTA